jgi:sulfonate transport system substrate-binding protein
VSQGLAKELAKDTSLTMVIAMRNDYMQKNPDAVEKFLRAHKAALLFAASDHSRANGWFREPENARTLDPKIIQTATAYDPQWNAKSLKDIRISFNDAEMARYLALGKTAYSLKVFPKEPPLKEKTDMSVAKKVDGSDWRFDLSKVQVKSN